MAKTSNQKARWMDFNEANLKKYIREKIREEKMLGNKITVVRLAPLLKMSRTTLYKYVAKFNLRKYFY